MNCYPLRNKEFSVCEQEKQEKMDILKLLTTPQTAWTLKEIAIILEIPIKQARFKIFRWCKKGYLRRIRKGLYIRTDRDYNSLEIAERIFRPSYISFYTALFLWGAITQGTWNTITVASYLSREVTTTANNTANDWTIKAVKIKKDLLLYTEGILFPGQHNFGSVTIATPERALLDTLYNCKMDLDIQFCNVFDKKKLYKLLKGYFKSKTTRKKYEELIEKSLS